jgi:hypothetical protein
VGAQIVLTNQGTSAQRTVVTDASGNYALPNLDQGTYELTIQASGFQEIRDTSLILQARETMRVDGALKVGSQSQTVEVVAGAETVLNTDTSNLAETKTSLELVELPVAITSRSTGSTSPMSTLTTQPGVQTDASGNISVGGVTPALLSMTLDGLSTMGTRAGAPLTELFPSFNAIEEIRVSEFNNTAEFGGISDITTVSKSGTNKYHGGAYDNWQNADITAKNPFSLVKSALNMNDFGGYVGGPLSIPGLYHGHDRTFFFGSYEGLRLPSSTTLVESVPSHTRDRFITRIRVLPISTIRFRRIKSPPCLRTSSLISSRCRTLALPTRSSTTTRIIFPRLSRAIRQTPASTRT